MSEKVNRKSPPPMNTILQLSTPYTPALSPQTPTNKFQNFLVWNSHGQHGRLIQTTFCVAICRTNKNVCVTWHTLCSRDAHADHVIILLLADRISNAVQAAISATAGLLVLFGLTLNGLRSRVVCCRRWPVTPKFHYIIDLSPRGPGHQPHIADHLQIRIDLSDGSKTSARLSFPSSNCFYPA